MLLIGGGVAAAIVVVLALVLFNRSGDDGLAPVALPPPSSADVERSGRSMGAADAPVTVVEWGDYQCPGCEFFWQNGKPQLIQNYVATGQVRFEFRDYAFLGRESIDAAVAASCAEQQGKFWEYHDILYFNHNGENQGAFSESRLREMAQLVGLDMDQWSTCFDDDAVRDAVSASLQEGRNLGVNSTPTFIINGGEPISGGNWEPLRQRIDAALAEQ